MTLLITLTVADIDTGPFNLYANGNIVPFEELIEKSVLLAGYTSTAVPDGTTSIEVRSVNELCNNFIILIVDATTSTTTSTTSTSTSTTTTTTTSLPSILICDQEWTLYNLDVETYRNGDVIPQVTDPTQWANLTTGAWCYFNNDPSNELVYGKLYNWYAVNDPRGLAPTGYHIPSDAEWTILTNNCLGGDGVGGIAGGEMKATGTTLWSSPNVATNSSGFTGLPGGWRGTSGTFNGINNYGSWWSSTEYNLNTTLSWFRQVYHADDNATRYYFSKVYGFSVRLIKD